jgi:hypothetical protein
MQTVRDATYQLFREPGLTTIFGNVGSTEETSLKNLPKDFRYVLAPQEASVVAIADGLAQEYAPSGAGEPAHHRHCQWDGEYRNGFSEQNSPYRDGWPANTRDASDGTVAY